MNTSLILTAQSGALRRAIVIAMSLGLLACGQTGELRLPDEPSPSPAVIPAADDEKNTATNENI